MRNILLLMLFSLAPMLVKAQKKTTPAPSAVMQAGEAIYMQRCTSCHQADGTGAQNMIPPLIGTEQVLGNKPWLIGIVLNGLTGEIQVNGDLYAGEMPAHADLKDNEIAAVLTYVRNSFGNKAPAVTAAEVKKARAAKKK